MRPNGRQTTTNFAERSYTATQRNCLNSILKWQKGIQKKERRYVNDKENFRRTFV